MAERLTVDSEALRRAGREVDGLDPSTGKTGSAVVFVGNSACVAPDGSVDTTNPS